MSDIVFGEIDWNAGDVGGPKSDFMRLEEGESVVRVMGNPVQFYIHWVTAPDGAKRKVNSPISSPELVRRLEDAGFRRQARWLVKVLDRSDNEFKLLEVGSQIYNGIRALYNNQKWGKVTAYDVSINRGPKGSQPLYGVTPNPKEALSAEYKASFVDFNDRLNVEKLITPATAEFICEVMGWDISQYSTSDSESGESTGDDTEFDFDFE